MPERPPAPLTNEESLLRDDPNERFNVDQIVPDGMVDEANVETDEETPGDEAWDALEDEGAEG